MKFGAVCPQPNITPNIQSHSHSKTPWRVTTREAFSSFYYISITTGTRDIIRPLYLLSIREASETNVCQGSHSYESYIGMNVQYIIKTN